MLGLIMLFLIIGAGLAYGAKVYRERKIEPGFDTFFAAIVWHALWGIGWGFILIGIALLFFWIPFSLFHLAAWLLFMAGFVLFLLGAFPFLFGKLFAAAVGFFTDEIGDTPIVNTYFRKFHHIYWGSQYNPSPSSESDETIQEQKTKDYAKTDKKASVVEVKYSTRHDLKFLCKGKTFDIVSVDGDDVLLDTEPLLGYQLSFKKEELSIRE